MAHIASYRPYVAWPSKECLLYGPKTAQGPPNGLGSYFGICGTHIWLWCVVEDEAIGFRLSSSYLLLSLLNSLSSIRTGLGMHKPRPIPF